MIPSEIQVPFLGQRKYIQGPSILLRLLEGVPEVGKFNFKVYHQISSDRISVTAADTTPSSDRPSALLTMGDGKDGNQWQLRPAPISENPPRDSYDETIIWDAAVIESSTISLGKASPYDYVATATSLNKRLLSQLHPSDQPGRWLFIGTALERLPRVWESMSVRLESYVASARCARSSLWCDGARIGVLDFAWKSEL
jgi:hypothetical protein